MKKSEYHFQNHPITYVNNPDRLKTSMATSNNIVEELVCDDSFCKLVTEPDEHTLKKWNDFRKDNPDKIAAMEEAKKIVLLLGNEKAEVGAEERVSAVWQKLQTSVESPHDMPHHSTVAKSNSAVLWKAAAVVALFIGAFFVLNEMQDKPVEEIKLATANHFVRTTPMGQKSTVYLPDGSQVMMNAGSAIKYHEDLENGTRKLVLEGEAFFDIKKDSLRPFTVTTENIKTTVLGTSFNIRAYKEEAQIDVALVTGKVALANSNKPTEANILLNPNDMVSYHKAENSTSKQTFNPDKVLAWTEKTLYFEDVNFDELTTVLERWYGVKFIVEPSAMSDKEFLERKDYKGKYINKSLDTVLKAVGFSYGFNYEIKNKTVRIM